MFGSARLSDVVNWAKDRALDDLYALITETNQHGMVMSTSEFKQFAKRAGKIVQLLNLPVQDISIQYLAKAGYWNIHDDTFWESVDAVPEWYLKWSKPQRKQGKR